MGDFLDAELKKFGVETKRVDIGTHTMEGVQLKLPPLVLGRIGNDPSKKTLLIYGHFDVQPVRDVVLQGDTPSVSYTCHRRSNPTGGSTNHSS